MSYTTGISLNSVQRMLKEVKTILVKGLVLLIETYSKKSVTSLDDFNKNIFED